MAKRRKPTGSAARSVRAGTKRADTKRTDTTRTNATRTSSGRPANGKPTARTRSRRNGPVDPAPPGSPPWAAAGATLIGVLFLVGPVFFEARGLTFNPSTTRLLTVGVMGLAAVWVLAVTASRERALPLPRSWTLAALGAFVVAAVVAATHAEVTASALLGSLMRGSGLVLYASAAAVFLLLVALLPRERTPVLLTAAAATAAVVALHGGLQYLGMDPLPRETVGHSSPIEATLGNPNFASALMGMGLAPLTWLTLRADWSVLARSLAGAGAVLALVVAALSDSVQGPVAGLLGLVVLAVAWVLERVESPGAWIAGLLGSAAAGLGLLIAGLAAGLGPLVRVAELVSLGPRLWYWEAAARMVQEAPVLGVGLGMYEHRYRALRPAEQITERGTGLTTDAAHSVPLQMFAEGGLLLGLAYLAFVVATGVTLLVGLRRLQGSERLALGAVGGAWIAYQAQSAVSIDVPPLAAWHFTLAALIVVLTTRRTLLGPGAPRRRTRGQRLVGSATALVATVALIAGTWGLTGQYRADATVLELEHTDAEADPIRALELADEATALQPGRVDYWASYGQAMLDLGDQAGALDVYERAIEANPHHSPAVGAAARLASNLGEDERAEELWRDLAHLDPHHVDLQADAARFFLQHGDIDEALERLEHAVTVVDDDPELWQLLAVAYAEAGDDDAAAEADDRAIELAEAAEAEDEDDGEADDG